MKKENQNNRLDVEPKHLTIVKTVLDRIIPTEQVWVYGSRVNGTSKKHSDLDLVIFKAKPKKITALKNSFEESDLPYRVDIMEWETLPESFKQNILSKFIVLQGKETIFSKERL